ncbi:MAG: 16S rRNA (uracil(1498)-N(3))-methyltransferase [Verrucomicrobiota bacterium]
MPRFYIPPARWNLDRLLLDEDETHHATDVLRMKAGDRATVFNGEGACASVELAHISKRAIELKLLTPSQSAPPACRITLGQAIPKGKNMDLIVQKATELGAASVVPLTTERTVVQFEARDAEKKREKWQAVAIEACKQCGQNWLPAVLPPQTLAHLFAETTFDLLLIASLAPGALHPKTVLADFLPTTGARPKSVLILIGPEGDFTPAEIALALARGCRPITLGPIVLRTETAALYCLSVLSYELLG